MVIKCSWCGVLIGVKEPMNDHSVTHGICEECAEKFKTEQLVAHPEVSEEEVPEEQAPIVFKCGCTYGRGKYIFKCWRHNF